MRVALDILYADAKVLEENAFTCLDNAYDKQVAHQATHQVSLDTAKTRRADPRKLEEYGAKFNKARGIWEVPAFKSLLPFMPFISEATRISLYPGIFARVGERMESLLEAESKILARATEYTAARRKTKLRDSKIAADTVSKLETEVSLGMMADGTSHGKRSVMPRHTTLKLPAPPPGYRWESAPLD